MPTPLRARHSSIFAAVLAALVLVPFGASQAHAAAGPDTTLQHYTGASTVLCPCFNTGEHVGAVFFAPASHYPIEILRVGIGWASQFGGAPQSLEQGLHIYADDLPDPGAPIFTLPGPVMTDGVINEFNLEPIAGQIIIPSDSFTVSLEFQNQNAAQVFAPTVFSDGNGCTPGLNVIKAIPGGWLDACQAGVTGDWMMYVVYRACGGTVGIGNPLIASSQPTALMPARPNPFSAGTSLQFFLAESGHATLGVYDLAGRHVATLADGTFGSGTHQASWDGRGRDGSRLNSGTYFVKLNSGEHHSVRKIVLTD